MNSQRKPEGDLRDAPGVVLDKNGKPRFELEYIQKGGFRLQDGPIEQPSVLSKILRVF